MGQAERQAVRGDRLGDSRGDARVEHAGHDVAGVELVRAHAVRDGLGGRHQHRGGDVAGRRVEQPAEQPGKASTLLIWLGKSLRPVATTVACLAASIGWISGSGLARANTMASSVIVATCSAPSMFGPETPMKTSAPTSTSCRVPESPVRVGVVGDPLAVLVGVGLTAVDGAGPGAGDDVAGPLGVQQLDDGVTGGTRAADHDLAPRSCPSRRPAAR